MSASTRGTENSKQSSKIRGHAGIIPPGRKFLLYLGLLFSILFIVCVSLAFVGGRREALIFRDDLNSVAHEGGGVSRKHPVIICQSH